jgi:hypothetical protein
MKTSYWIFGLSLLISTELISPILAGDVKSQTAKNADFAHYQTYQWFPPRVLTKTGEVQNAPLNPVLKELVGQQLAQKGLSEVASGGDLQIQATVLTDTTAQLEAVIFAFFPADMSEGTFASIGRYNRSGTLYLNLIDHKTNQSAWAAMATETLPNGELKPELVRSKLDQAVKAIFKKYPEKK